MSSWSELIKNEPGNMCFGCGKANPIGLKLEFQLDGHGVRAEFTPEEFHQGWSGVLHGGITACVMDEALGNATVFEGIYSVTTKLDITLRKPALVGQPLIVTASMTNRGRRFVETQGRIVMTDGTVVAEAKGTHFILKTGQPIPATGLKAVIWDMDGVIADTARFHFKSWQQAFAKRGIEFSEAQFKPLFGRRNDNIIRTVMGEGVAQAEVDAITHDKETGFRHLAKGNIKPFPGAIELLKELAEKDFKLALASSAPRENTDLVLNSLGIYGYFDVIVHGRDVTESKPSPQLFLTAAESLGVRAENCVVIEDAIAGVEAAKRAGMKCMAVTTTNPKQALARADVVVDSLKSITVSDLEKLVSHQANR